MGLLFQLRPDLPFARRFIAEGMREAKFDHQLWAGEAKRAPMPTRTPHESVCSDFPASLQPQQSFFKLENVIVVNKDIGSDSFPEIGSVEETPGAILPKESAARQVKYHQASTGGFVGECGQLGTDGSSANRTDSRCKESQALKPFHRPLSPVGVSPSRFSLSAPFQIASTSFLPQTVPCSYHVQRLSGLRIEDGNAEAARLDPIPFGQQESATISGGSDDPRNRLSGLDQSIHHISCGFASADDCDVLKIP